MDVVVPCLVLLCLFLTNSVKCSTNSSSNVTDTSELCSNGTCNKTLDPIPLPDPFWCPDGYELMRMQKNILQTCRPLSCAKSTTEAHPPLCVKAFQPDFQNCSKVLLNEDQYGFDVNGSLLNFLDKKSPVPLGEYFIQFGKAMVCDWRENPVPESAKSSGKPSIETPAWCMPFDVPKGGYSDQSGTLYVNRISDTVGMNYYTIAENGTAHVCPKMDPKFYQDCISTLGIIPTTSLQFLPNMDIQDNTNILRTIIYHMGEYMLFADRNSVLICLQPAPPLNESVTIMYGVFALISAFCLLLALLAHIFFPTLNYHTKALLCLAFSFLIMYICMAIRNFCGNFETAASNITLFSFQYIFGLAAFFWLSILSFDLWRVFSKLKGTISGNTVAKKRKFLAKCAYAWGIPVLLCIMVIALAYSPNVQARLGLVLPLQQTNWILDTKSILIVFYTPIIVVLVENLVFFILTIINIRKASSGADILNKRVSQKLFKVYMKLFLVMGITWLAEIISWLTVAAAETSEAVWYVTDTINCLQGVFIFLIYVCKRRTLLIIKNKIGHISSSQMNSSTSTTQDKDRKISMASLQSGQNKNVMESAPSSVEPHRKV